MLLLEHLTFIMLSFMMPIVGWLFYRVFSKRVIITILSISLLTWLPSIAGFKYVIDNLISIALFLSLSLLYALFENINIKGTIGLSVSLFLVGGFINFTLGLGAVTNTVEREWSINDYKIEHIISQGFAGRPASFYVLNKYAFIPILVKSIDTISVNDDYSNCWIMFSDHNFKFNKCN